MTVKTKNTFLNATFMLWLGSELLFSYSIFSRLTLFAFLFASFGTLLRTHRVYKNSFDISYILFAVFSLFIISAGYAINRSVAGEMTNTVLLNCLFLVSFTQYCGIISDPVEILKLYKNEGIIVAIIMFFLGLSSFLSGDRLTIVGINANAIASIVAYSLVVHVYQIYYDRGRMRAKDFLIIALFIAVLLFTASRKGLLVAFFGWYILLAFKKPKQLLKITLLFVGIAAILLYLILNVGFLYDVIGYRVEALMLFLQGENFDEASLAMRDRLNQSAWENSQDNLFWGHGLDCFRLIPESYGRYSHNNYAELIFSVGILGTVIYYSSSLFTLLRVPKMIKRRNKVVYLLMAILIPFLICDFMNVTYFTRRMLIIPSIAIMFLGKCINEENNSIAQNTEYK